MKQGNVSKRGGNGGETKSISDSEEGAQIDPSHLIIRVLVQLEPVVHNGRNIILLPIGAEQIRRENGERFGAENVEPPVRNGHHHVDERHVPHEDVHDGEERADQRVAQERRHRGPVQRERPEPEPRETRPELLGRY